MSFFIFVDCVALFEGLSQVTFSVVIEHPDI